MAKIPKYIIPTTKGYGYKHMLQARGAWYEFKVEMLMGLYDAGLKETCLFFMPQKLKKEKKIEAVY